VHKHSIGNFVSNASSTHLNFFESEKNLLGGHTRGIHRLKEILKVIEYFGGKTIQRRHKGENKISEDSIELCQEGIE
jgi:hypothetical protein